MKVVLTLSLWFSAALAWADHYDNKTILDCRVTEMKNYRYFEEALSEEEYPTIDVARSLTGEYSMGVGGRYPYEKSEGDLVTFQSFQQSNVKTLRVTVRTQYGDLVILSVTSSPVMSREFEGRLSVREKGEFKTVVIADVSCKFQP